MTTGVQNAVTAASIAAATKASEGIVNFFGELVGEPVKNVAGLMGSDWLMVVREENLERLRHKSRERLEAKGITQPEKVSLSVAVPLLAGAADESREELADLWAKLLAAAQDSRTSKQVSRYFIDAIKRMEPIDALILKKIRETENFTSSRDTASDMGQHLLITADVAIVSFSNLIKIGFVVPKHGGNPEFEHKDVQLTAKGREFLRLVE